MSKEEKKAVEILKDFKEGKVERDKLEINNGGGFKLGFLYLISIQNAIDTILNLIEKLQEENKKLKDKKTLVHIDEKGNIEPISGKYIPIEDLEEVIENRAFDIKDYLTVIDVNDLKELLKEE